MLRIDGPACDGRSPCFAFVNASPDLPVPATYDQLPVLYVPVGTYDPQSNPTLPQKLSDNFSPLSENFSYILKCWHLATMSTTDYQDPGCQNNVFAMPAADDAYGYVKVAMGSGPNNAVPFAWTYVSTLSRKARNADTWETGQDVTEADSLKVGVKASVNVMGVEASSHLSVGVASKVQEMYRLQADLCEGGVPDHQVRLRPPQSTTPPSIPGSSPGWRSSRPHRQPSAPTSTAGSSSTSAPTTPTRSPSAPRASGCCG